MLLVTNIEILSESCIFTSSSVIHDQYQVSMVSGISSSVLFGTLTDLSDLFVCHAALPLLTIAARDLILITDGNLSIRV